jgi:uncharacterized protein YgbK (DUF1537 family)
MHDSNLVNVLARQTPHKTGLVAHDVVKQGAQAIASAFADLQARGIRHAIVDAIEDIDLIHIGEAAAKLALITGGSGATIGLPENFRNRDLCPSAESQSRSRMWAAAALFSQEAARRQRSHRFLP